MGHENVFTIRVKILWPLSHWWTNIPKNVSVDFVLNGNRIAGLYPFLLPSILHLRVPCWSLTRIATVFPLNVHDFGHNPLKIFGNSMVLYQSNFRVVCLVEATGEAKPN